MVGHWCSDHGTVYTPPARCPQCQRQREGSRPSRQVRGYGRDHSQARAALATLLPAQCAYGCGTLLMPEDDWVAAHLVDGDDQSPRMAACRSCNEKAKRRLA